MLNKKILNIDKKGDVFIIRKYDFLKNKTNLNIKKRIPWTLEEDELLIRLVTTGFMIDRNDISKHFEARSNIQCEERWNKVLKPGLRKGKWSKDEDDLLLNFVRKFGPQNWGNLAIILKGRTPKQIRDRWVNNLNPKRLNFKWNEELDKILLENYLIYGSKWTKISENIFGTTENVVKNRFYSLLRSTAIRYSSNLNREQEIIENRNCFKSVEMKRTFFEEVEVDNFFNIFNYEELNLNNSTSNDKSFCKGSNEIKKKIKKRDAFSLHILLKYLPYLLEERGIDILKSEEKDNELENSHEDHTNTLPSIDNSKIEHSLVDHQEVINNDNNITKKILLFTNILEKIDNKFIKKDSFKIKSSIMLNLQLSLLNKIFHRLKTQMVQKFFESFRGNTLNN